MGRLLLRSLSFFCSALLASSVFGLERKYQPVILTGNHFVEMIGIPIDNLVLMNYKSASNSWHGIPFQIDQITDGSYFGFHSGILSEPDELVFLAKDLADEAPDSSWPNLNNTTIAGRYKIEMEDPLTNSNEEKGVIYLVLVLDPLSLSIQDFVSPDQTNDRIVSRFFEMGFNQDNGLPEDLQITQDNGGDNLDFLDRLKIHIAGQVNLAGFGNIPINLDEESGIVKFDSSGFENPRYLDGPVRVIRDLFITLQIPLGGFGNIPLPGIFGFRMQFFPYSMVIKLENLDFSILSDLNGQLNSIRVSFDHNIHATGMTFLNASNTLTIDGNVDSNVDLSLSVPGFNWNMATGNPGSIFTNIFVPALGDEQLLYYHDDKNGGSADETDDSGDGVSYGDAGFMARGSITSGSFDLFSTSYFLPANQTRMQAEQLFAWEQNPLQLTQTVYETQTTDVTNEPIPVRFFLLKVYPNPYLLRDSTALTLQFSLIERDEITLSLVNALGQIIAQKESKSLSIGKHQIDWDLRQLTEISLPTGLYWIVAQGQSSRQTQKILLLR
ncbi:T9SS type A sorting domain-containing protein [candidate division KSB1 bacterium]|nr:T9SS type A sorting domain-containing protein [candidate division KSB1 bacterium]